VHIAIDRVSISLIVCLLSLVLRRSFVRFFGWFSRFSAAFTVKFPLSVRASAVIGFEGTVSLHIYKSKAKFDAKTYANTVRRVHFPAIRKGQHTEAVYWLQVRARSICAFRRSFVLFLTPHNVLVWMVRSFVQDGASQHTAELMDELFEREGITKVEGFPARSPDLNLIENVWAEMARGMMGHSVWSESGLVAAIRQEWAKISDSYIQRLYGSWWDRLQAVKDAEGGVTRY
jgi:hypothetical protein